MVNALTQGIASQQPVCQVFCKALDHRNFCRQPGIADTARERRGLTQQVHRLQGKVPDHAQQRGAGCRRIKRGDLHPGSGQIVSRQVHPVERQIVLPAVLQMVDDLQGGAQGIVQRPQRAVLAMHIEHIAPHRHGRKAAIGHQGWPIGMAAGGAVQHKRIEQIVRMGQVKPQFPRHPAQHHGFRRALTFKPGAHMGEQPKLLFLRRGGMIGYVIRQPGEGIERHHRCAVLRLEQP